MLYLDMRDNDEEIATVNEEPENAFTGFNDQTESERLNRAFVNAIDIIPAH